MIDNKGWVKTYRSLMDKGYYTDSCAVHLWTHIIFKANHSEREFMWNGSIIKVERGSFVTGRKKLSLETGIEESKIYRLLKMFESEQQIEQRTNNRNSIITVVNYDEYQASEQRMNNGRTTDEQRMNTTKELKHLENKRIEDLFAEFYSAYPRKVSKEPSRKAFVKLNPSDDLFVIIMDALELHKKVWDDPQFIPHPSSWLNQRRWEDEFKPYEKKAGRKLDVYKNNGEDQYKDL